MMKNAFGLIVAASLAAQAHADVITFSPNPGLITATRKVSAAESAPQAGNGGSAPVDGDVYQIRVTTDSDILSVDRVTFALEGGAVLFNNTFGDAGNANAPNPGLVAAFAALGADTYVTTPGAVSSRLGPDLPGGPDTAFTDLTSDGPASNFLFAQFTVPAGTRGTFSGRVNINSTVSPGTPFGQEFSFQFGVPEPASVAMAGIGLIGIVGAGLRRRSK